ncbi:MAG: glutamine synthetase III [Rhabdochlamydiaceae bacterium]|jgi:glutamine synthetase
MNPRFKAIRDIQRRSPDPKGRKREVVFGQETFHRAVMEKMLPKNIWTNLKEAIEGKGKLNPSNAQTIAEVMKEWAIKNGATHFCHWFSPQTGLAAEKQDAFIDWNRKGELIEKFSGNQLMRGEPDASSFPSGGLRTTAEARGYTVWDPTSIPFLWEMGDSKVLCLPSIYFSWTGKALDMKIPLMRSDDKLNQAALRLLNLFEIESNSVFCTVGCEQEFFLIDRTFYLLRPDLILTGRTLCGSSPAKGQELEDHYFGTIKERVGAFMVDLEQKAYALGIPLKTRHAEVAPAQFEFAPLFEKASIAVDHNILLMELMRQVATRHHLVCLLHEKPFARINGSGKHCNWSLATDTGLNLLDPNQPQLVYLAVLTAVIYAVNEHATLLRASIATSGNDHRLGGHEAPPAIISIYLGEALERWLTSIEQDRAHQSKTGESLDLGIPPIPDIPLDETDRNRTSPFAFTGNKFEFRAVGSSQNCALPVAVLNVIVASGLNQIVDEIEKGVMKKKPLKDVTLDVARKFLKASKGVRFSGDGYSAHWQKEAKKRKLPMIEKSLHALAEFITPKSIKVFEGVLSKQELESRTRVMTERYCKTIDIETRLLHEMFQTQILPAALKFQKDVAESIKLVSETGHSLATSQMSLVKKISQQISVALDQVHLMEKERQKASQLPHGKKGSAYADQVIAKVDTARKAIDGLEEIVDDHLWPLPKYWEMLHIL